MNKIKTIAHLADIHIRKLHRFVEYREVFDRLYNQLEQLHPSLIYIGGDIVHGKLDTSPEETRLVADFFLTLCGIAPTIIIPGNHDCNLNNKSREDTLSPIVDLVKQINPNIYYWKKSGIYTIDNVDFGVMSIFDINDDGNQITTNLPNPKDMNNEHKIALFHGSVGTFLYDNGFQVTDENVHVSTFDGYDLTLLGDIHLHQFLDKDGKIGYPGSLIQQGFAEIPSHGFLLWDVESKSSEFHHVKNDYGFKVIEVMDGVIQNKMKFVPSKGNIKIKYWGSSLEQIKDIQIDLRKKYPKLKEIKIERQDVISIDKNGRSNKINIGDVRDINYQNSLIKDFFTDHFDDIDDDTISRICKINEMTNNSPEIYDGDITRNVTWKLKSFEFDNMFSYGEGSKIDFTKLNGMIGLVAPNHSGKSSLIDSIAYTIFDTCSRTWKSIDVLNKKKKSFKSKLNIEINGDDYWIEREGILKSRVSRKTGDTTYSCPQSVKFYMIENDEKVDMSGASRRNSQYGGGTNEEIRRILGTFDDFILTSLSLQGNGTNFIDKKQSERKQILSQFMDIDIFDQIFDIAKNDSSEERVLLKSFKKRNSYIELSTISSKISQLEIDENKLSIEEIKLRNEINDMESDKLVLIKKLWNVDTTDVNINNLLSDKSKLNNDLITMKSELKSDIEYKEVLRPMYMEYHEKLDNIDEESIENNFHRLAELNTEIVSVSSNLEMISSEIKLMESHLTDLSKYKYDPNCNYCIDNSSEHILDIDSTNEKLNSLINKCESYTQKLQLLIDSKELIKDADKLKMESNQLHDEFNRISNDATKISGNIGIKENKIKHIKSEISIVTDKIDQFYEFEEKIKENISIDSKIKDISDEISTLELKKQNTSNKYTNVLTELSVANNEKRKIEEDIQKLIDVEQKINDYDLYLMAIGKDGIPYDLISKTIPAIEKEVNEVLDNMMVGFTLSLDMDGKNISTNICYGETCWSLELSSGMEKFVSSLAIRIGLINVSTLPRSTFLVIDEGFGALDGDNIANMEGAFNYLKTQFDFVMIISHLDTIKDYMNQLIPIEVTNDFSQTTYLG